MHSKNLTLLTDLYELTMMQGYYDKQDNPTVIFDVFYRSNPFLPVMQSRPDLNRLLST